MPPGRPARLAACEERAGKRCAAAPGNLLLVPAAELAREGGRQLATTWRAPTACPALSTPRPYEPGVGSAGWWAQLV